MKRKIFALFFVFIFLFSLVSCNSSNGGVSGGGDSGNEIVDKSTTLKIIYTVNYDLECDDINSCMSGIINKSKELDGYILTSRISDNYANYTIKVPTSKLDDFLDYVDGLGNTTNKSVTTDDVTSNYNRITSEIEVLEARRDAYINMLKNDNLSLSDELEINKALDDVSSRLQSLYYDKASFDSKIDYSTINFYCRSGIKKEGFFSQYLTYLKNFFVGIGKGFMYILPFGAIGGIIAVIIIVVEKNKKKKRINNSSKDDNA